MEIKKNKENKILIMNDFSSPVKDLGGMILKYKTFNTNPCSLITFLGFPIFLKLEMTKPKEYKRQVPTVFIYLFIYQYIYFCKFRSSFPMKNNILEHLIFELTACICSI